MGRLASLANLSGSKVQNLSYNGPGPWVGRWENTHTNSTTLKSLALLSVLGAAALVFTTTSARSQLSVANNYVALQPSSPGTAQSGHGNISGTSQAGQFVGGGSGLSGLNASSLASGTLGDARLSPNVAMRNASNTFAGTNQFNGFVGVRRNSGQVTFAESFGIGEASTGFDRMYVRTGPTGRPFYGYATGLLSYHYVDGADGSWRFYHGEDTRLMLTAGGNLGLNTVNPQHMLDVNGTVSAAGLRMPTGAGDGYFLRSDASGAGSWFQSAWIQPDISNLQTAATVRIENISGVAPDSLVRMRSAAINPTLVVRNLSDANPNIGRTAILSAVRGTPNANAVTGTYSVAESATNTIAIGAAGVALGPATNYGLFGSATGGTTNYGVYGQAANPGWAGYFGGSLFANASSAGVKSFLIDHPLDPANKFLEHSSIESNERMNLYRGQIVTDAKGFATINVPDWFSALNENIQAQLTVVDDSEEFIIAKVVRQNPDGSFRIRTSQAGIQVNWMLSGVRKDPTSNHRPMQVERMKSGYEKGKYLDPEAYGLGPEHSMVERPRPDEDRKRAK